MAIHRFAQTGPLSSKVANSPKHHGLLGALALRTHSSSLLRIIRLAQPSSIASSISYLANSLQVCIHLRNQGARTVQGRHDVPRRLSSTFFGYSRTGRTNWVAIELASSSSGPSSSGRQASTVPVESSAEHRSRSSNIFQHVVQIYPAQVSSNHVPRYSTIQVPGHLLPRTAFANSVTWLHRLVPRYRLSITW